MRRFMVLGTVLVALLGVGCAGRLHSRINTSKGLVYVGMSSDAIVEVLGPPETVGDGPYGCQYTSNFFMLTAGDHTVEWTWCDRLSRIVAWLEYNRVFKLGLIRHQN